MKQKALYATLFVIATVCLLTTTVVIARQSGHKARLGVDSPATISGRVLERIGMPPYPVLPGKEVFLSNGGDIVDVAITNGNGIYSFIPIMQGNYTISVESTDGPQSQFVIFIGEDITLSDFVVTQPDYPDK